MHPSLCFEYQGAAVGVFVSCFVLLVPFESRVARIGKVAVVVVWAIVIIATIVIHLLDFAHGRRHSGVARMLRSTERRLDPPCAVLLPFMELLQADPCLVVVNATPFLRLPRHSFFSRRVFFSQQARGGNKLLL